MSDGVAHVARNPFPFNVWCMDLCGKKHVFVISCRAQRPKNSSDNVRFRVGEGN